MSEAIRSLLDIVLRPWTVLWSPKVTHSTMPLIIQIVQPLPVSKHSKDIHTTSNPFDQNLDNFSHEVTQAFETPLDPTTLLEFTHAMQAECRDKLHHSDISMLPSYQCTLPSGKEEGDFLALDIGGSTFRAALVSLHNGKQRVTSTQSFVIDETVRQLVGDDFFDWMADRISSLKTEYDLGHDGRHAVLPIGVAWSFPIEQTSLRSGKLLRMGKGFRADHGLEGQDLGELIMRSCRRRGLKVKLCAIVNDSSATLLSKAYEDSSTRMSLILGTGTNTAMYLPVKAISHDKFQARSDGWCKTGHVVVNTELSTFGREYLSKTRWDDKLNAAHTRPDFQPLEYLTTGRYVGEIARLVILEAIIHAGLFNGRIPLHFTTPYSFDTRTLASFESDSCPQLEGASREFLAAHPLGHTPSRRDLCFIREVARAIARRAAAYLAVSLHALWAVHAASEDMVLSSAPHLTVACTGSMIERYPGYRKMVQEDLDVLCKSSGAARGAVTLEMAPEGSLLGAAVAAACALG